MAIFRGNRRHDVLRGTGDDDRLIGMGGRDRLFGNNGDDVLLGGVGRDRLFGGRGSDTLDGGRGNDRLVGGAGADDLNGGVGRDRLIAGTGADTLAGGRGNDTLTGGRGADQFNYAEGWGDDTITDFNVGAGDVLDFSDTDLSFSDLTIAAQGDDVLVSVGNDSILLRNVSLDEVTEAAFEFDKVDTDNSEDEGKVETTGGQGELSTLSNEGRDIIGLDQYQNDARFSGFDGSGQTVVVIDTGIDLNHSAFGPDANGDGISDRIIYTEDFSRDGDGTANDIQGHGTNVASIVGSSNASYLGVAPGVNIIALQGLGNNGSGTNSDIERALQWVVDNAAAYNIVAVNLSLGAGDNVNTVSPHYTYGDEFAALASQNVITVAAAGNDYYRYQTPGASSIAADPNVIGVGAVWEGDFGSIQWGSGAKDFSTDVDRVTSFSQRSNDLGIVFAPGALIDGAQPGGGFSAQGGTSQATPFVAGMAALAQDIATDVLGRRLTPSEFQRLLRETSTTIRDGDDEDDNVANLNAEIPRVNMFELAQAIYDLAEDDPTPVPEPREDDFSSDTSTTGRIGSNSTATGELETSGDTDWFRVRLREGRTYELSMRGDDSDEGTLNDPVLALVDAQGNILASNDDGPANHNSLITYTAQSTGNYYLVASGYGSETGTYTVGIERTSNRRARDDFSADTSTTSNLDGDGTIVRGRIEVQGDRDWHRLDVAAGAEYRIDMHSRGGPNVRLEDSYLRIYDENGTLLASNDDGGNGQNARLFYTASSDGTIYVETAASGDAGSGRYRVRVQTTEVEGDVPNDASTSARVEVGGHYDGTLEAAGDRDWVAVSLVGGVVYDIALFGHGDTPVSDTYLRLFDANGSLIASNDDADGLNSALDSISFNASGTYFISAGSYADGGEGDYRVTVEELSGDGADIPTDTSTESEITIGGSVVSDLGFEGDRDWHRATLVAGHTYEIEVEGVGSDALGDTYLRVYNGQSSLLAQDDDGGDGLNSRLLFNAGNGGDFYFSVGAYADGGTGGYEISLVDTGASDDFAGDSSTTGRLTTSVDGEIEQVGDTDWFAYRVQNGGIYQFDARGASTSDGTLGDPVLAIRDEYGNLLGYNDDGGDGLNSQAVFSATYSGTVYVEVSGYGSTSIGTYELDAQVLSNGDDDHGDAIDPSLLLLDADEFVFGEIEEEGDVDFFRLELDAGGIYDLFARGAPTSDGSLNDPIMALFDTDGDVLVFNDDGGTGLNALIEDFEADNSGTYYLGVGGYGGNNSGTYTIGYTQTGSNASNDDFGQSAGSAGALASGSSITGTLEEAGDRDWIAVNLLGGREYEVDLRGVASNSGTLVDPYLNVYDSSGSFLGSNDDGGLGLESSLSFVAPSTDVFYFEAAAYADRYTGTWELEVGLA
ncbi:S8 family serine peptidase [Epibacterium sp. SM1979]|uniref:S8 family serine peptidase n=1 Tax=Tritonibacter litoralis TaxID=2662264 RepID=A0A843YF64_9RHOB|nr:S8 family serine peptidase [Tritonibacter litoralis]MQQ08315.1 S8 family serine peptidase [Tritonibacter litoralis]